MTSRFNLQNHYMMGQLLGCFLEKGFKDGKFFVYPKKIPTVFFLFLLLWDGN